MSDKAAERFRQGGTKAASRGGALDDGSGARKSQTFCIDPSCAQKELTDQSCIRKVKRCQRHKRLQRYRRTSARVGAWYSIGRPGRQEYPAKVKAEHLEDAGGLQDVSCHKYALLFWISIASVPRLVANL